MINRRTWRHLIRIWQSPLAGLTQATAVLACDWDIFTVTCFLVDVVLTHSKIGLAVLALVRGIFRVTGLVEAALQGRAGMGAHGHFHGHLLAAGDASPLHDRTGTLSSSRPAQCHAPELPHQARGFASDHWAWEHWTRLHDCGPKSFRIFLGMVRGGGGIGDGLDRIYWSMDGAGRGYHEHQNGTT